MDLRFDSLFFVVVGLDDDKQLFEELGHAHEDVDVGDRVQDFNPLNEDHLAVLADAQAELLADGFDQIIQVENEVLIQRPINHIFQQFIHFFRVILHVIIGCLLNQVNVFVENVQEILVSENGLVSRLDNVEHRFACCELHFLIRIAETLDYWR